MRWPPPSVFQLGIGPSYFAIRSPACAVGTLGLPGIEAGDSEAVGDSGGSAQCQIQHDWLRMKLLGKPEIQGFICFYPMSTAKLPSGCTPQQAHFSRTGNNFIWAAGRSKLFTRRVAAAWDFALKVSWIQSFKGNPCSFLVTESWCRVLEGSAANNFHVHHVRVKTMEKPWGGQHLVHLDVFSSTLGCSTERPFFLIKIYH